MSNISHKVSSISSSSSLLRTTSIAPIVLPSFQQRYFQQRYFQPRFFSSSSDISSQKSRLRRSVHFVPADNDKFLNKCLGLGADSLVLDLEDSVIEARKAEGREKVKEFLYQNATSISDSVSPQRSELLVRINPLDTEHWKNDLEAGMNADGFVLPKIEHADQIGEVVAQMERMG